MKPDDVFDVMLKIAKRYGHYILTDDGGYSVRFYHANTMFKVGASSILICGKRNSTLFKINQIRSMSCDTSKRGKCHLSIVTDSSNVKITITRWRVWA